MIQITFFSFYEIEMLFKTKLHSSLEEKSERKNVQTIINSADFQLNFVRKTTYLNLTLKLINS